MFRDREREGETERKRGLVVLGESANSCFEREGEGGEGM